MRPYGGISTDLGSVYLSAQSDVPSAARDDARTGKPEDGPARGTLFSRGNARIPDVVICRDVCLGLIGVLCSARITAFLLRKATKDKPPPPLRGG